jgi:hypothetical protein
MALAQRPVFADENSSFAKSEIAKYWPADAVERRPIAELRRGRWAG